MFVLQEPEDISVVEENEIVCLLPTRRGNLIFKFDFIDKKYSFEYINKYITMYQLV